jgi:hypothetical protein
MNRYSYALNDAIDLADPSGATPAPLQNNGWLLGGGGTCFVDGFATDCSLANGLLAMGAAVGLPPGASQSGVINGQFYYLTASSDDDGTYLDYNYFGLTAAQIEILGLPTEIDLAPFPTFSGDQTGSGSGPGSLTDYCRKRIISALNQVLGTNFTADNSVVNTQWAGIGKAVNITVNSAGTTLTAAQFNAITPGARWSLNSGVGSSVFGLGPALHIADPESLWDKAFAEFSNSNDGGVLSVQFTAHIDSGNSNLPFGFFTHLFKDIIGGSHRNPCP